MEVQIYNMDDFEGRLQFYKDKVSKIGGKYIIRGKDKHIEWIEPSHDEILTILKNKIKKDGEGKLINFGKRSRLYPYIQYDDGKPSYYHPMTIY